MVSGFALWLPNSPPVLWVVVELEVPNRPAAGLAVFPGGAPAGVVEFNENEGLAGVAMLAALVLVEDAALAPVFPNRDGPALPRALVLGAGAEDLVLVCGWLDAFWPKRPPVVELPAGVALAPPKRLEVGLFPVFPALPNKAGVDVVLVPEPPKRPPDEGAVVVDVVEEAVDVVAAGLPKRFEALEGVALPEPKSPPPDADDEPKALPPAGVLPKSPPDFGALLPSLLLLDAAVALAACCPNRLGVAAAGWVGLLLVAGPKEKVGVPEVFPKRLEDAGAVEFALLDVALVELGAPKLNDMAL